MWDVLLAAAAATPAFTAPQLVGDWYFGCDNGRYCAAIALTPISGDFTSEPEWYALALERAPHANAAPVISISTTNAEEPETRPQYGLELVVDGRPTGLRFTDDAKLAPGSDPMRAASLLGNGKSATLADRSGRIVGRISLDGAATALRTLDQRQLRAGTLTALIGKGHRPASAVPPPPRLPSIVAPPRSSAEPARLTSTQIARIHQDYECHGRAEDRPEFVRLDASTTLAIVPCSAEGSQGSSVLMLLDNDSSLRAATLEAAFRQDAMGGYENELIGPTFDPKRFVVEEVSGEAAMGDCGWTKNYVWDGSSFRLAFQEVMEHCRGSYDFIPVWRTANVTDWAEQE